MTICITFYTKRHLQFSSERYNILENDWLKKDNLKLFNIINYTDLDEIINTVTKQFTYLLDCYDNPGPAHEGGFGERVTLRVFEKDFLLDPRRTDHFDLLMLNDILIGLELSRKNQKDIYLIPRINSHEDHIPVIYRIKYFINEKDKEISSIYNYIKIEFEGRISKDFLDQVIRDLENFEIIKIDDKNIRKGKYFDFFH